MENKKKIKNRQNIEKILILRRNGLGDAVFTALAVKALHIKNPKIKFSILCNAYTKEIYKLICPELKLYVLPSEKYLGHFLGLFFHPIFKAIRKEHYDIIINSSASYSSRAIYMMKCCSAKAIAAIPSNKKTFWNFFINKKIKLPKNNLHQIKKIYNIFKQNNLLFQIPKKFIPRKIRNPKILLCPQSSLPKKQWDLKNWKLLYEHLNQDKNKVDICLPKNSYFNSYFFNKTQKPSNTKALILLLKEYDLIISQEGGIGHIASILRKSLITVSKNDLRSRWGAWLEDSDFIHGNGKISNITVKQVLKKTYNYLSVSQKINYNKFPRSKIQKKHLL
jgi:ADP-heptose:LPS heptosyltransferase